MLIKKLTLHNFGTYAGSQTLNLQTTPQKNIILVGGKNGAGKSTLLEAIRLCLYGQSYDRILTTRERYERYLIGRIHRGVNGELPAKSAFIEVEFDYADQDGVRTYMAKRAWERTAEGGIRETFELQSNGTPVQDVDAIHWQDFVKELIPTGVSDLFFFDGEKVQLLAEDESDRLTLSEAVTNLLGTDIIEKLSADLSIYRSRTVQSVSADANAPDLKILESAVELHRNRLSIAIKEADEATQSIEIVREAVRNLERKVQESGGAYARNRGKLDERKRQLSVRVAALELSVQEYAQGLLPLAVAPKLLKAVIDQLTLEQDLRFQCVLDDALSKAARTTLAQLRKVSIRKGSKSIQLGDVPEFQKILSVVKSTHKTPEWDSPMIHDLSNASEKQIRSWANEALTVVPKDLKRISEELESLYREQQKVERELSRIPQEEMLRPILEKLREANQQLSDIVMVGVQKNTVVEQARAALEKAETDYRGAVDSIAASSQRRALLDRAEQVQMALAEFKSNMIERRLKEVETELSRCFNDLSRKRLSRSIAINPNSFQVTIRDDHGRAVAKQELSAGEKQIYAISVLWALGRVSGRPLPVIIDTPLARLDRDHRALLGKRYFPYVSHQVIVLSTDTEFDNDFIPLLGDNIARSYELRFNSNSQSTEVKEGYFTEASTYEAY
jgi:DNA sulfur modification protein DndD